MAEEFEFYDDETADDWPETRDTPAQVLRNADRIRDAADKSLTQSWSESTWNNNVHAAVFEMYFAHMQDHPQAKIVEFRAW